MVDLDVLAQELFLARLVGKVPPYKVAVFLGLKQGDQVDAAPHLLAGVLTAKGVSWAGLIPSF